MWFKGHSGICTADTEEIRTYIHRVYSGDHLSLTFIFTHGADHLKLQVKAVPNTQASKVIHHRQQSHYPPFTISFVNHSEAQKSATPVLPPPLSHAYTLAAESKSL